MSSHTIGNGKNVVSDVLQGGACSSFAPCVCCCLDAVDYVLTAVVVCCRVGEVEHGDGKRCERHDGYSGLWITTREVIASVFDQRGYVLNGLIEVWFSNAAGGIDKNGEVGSVAVVAVLSSSFSSRRECRRRL